MAKCYLLLLMAVMLSVCETASSDDWPQWRGPNRDGISRETGLMASWPEQGPPLLWQVRDIDEGFSTPAVVGDQIYLLSNEDLDNEYVQALSVRDGSQVWATTIGKVGNPDQRPSYPAARSTPTIDGQWLYALGSDGHLVCLDRQSGKLRWKKSLRSDFGGKPGEWAYSESPLIDGDVLVCTPGGSAATLVALNKNDGSLIWKTAVAEGDEAAYASVMPLEVAGVKQYVQFLQKGVVGVDAETGKLLWRYEATAQGSQANIPTPVAHDKYVYTASGTGGGLVQVAIQDGQVAAEEVYFAPDLPKSIGGTVRVGDHLYGTTNRALMCVEFLTGDTVWAARSIGAGAVLFADGHLYLHGENGDVALVEATPEAYREKGRFTPPDQPEDRRGRSWTYPVIADGRLYIRDAGTLWCYDIAKSPQ